MQMFSYRFAFLLVISFSLISHAKAKRKPAAYERPPQFVLLGFDGSKDNAFWDESVAFADTVPTMSGAQKIKFTYFINPPYYLAKEFRKTYNTPVLGPGVSCIGFSDTTEGIAARLARTNRAFEAGHEIASHANSHCDQSGADKTANMYGRPWNFEHWNQEFEQFNLLLFGAYKINKIQPEKPGLLGNGFSFGVENISGFRAPLLATTPDLFPVLKKFNFRYDTSKIASPDYWPQRQTWGGWNIPLAQIKIAGSTRKTLSMDYNWLIFHSAGVSKKDLSTDVRKQYYDQMLESYKYYFKQNYFGNRAPVQIGHHFSKWNNGVYWDAMKEFSKFVCNKPEVRCVTFAEYANWLDAVDAPTLNAYRSGSFSRLPDDKTIKDIAAPVLADIRLDWSDLQFDAIVPEEFKRKVDILKWAPQIEVDLVKTGSATITRTDLMALVKKSDAGKPEFVGQRPPVIIRASLYNQSGRNMIWQTYKVFNLGTPTEVIEGPLEANIDKGLDHANAHD